MELRNEPTSDPSALIAAQTVPLGRLARSLVGAAGADDLVQETWTSYLRRPPTQEAPVGGFLATIARRLASKSQRSDARRREREELAARSERIPGPDEFAERSARLREVLEVLTALREPFRSTLWQRFFDDLPPREIARRGGESLATVKSRLQRGLELVRQEMDRRHGGRRSQWAIALAPLGAVGAGSLGVAISGGLLMGTVAKLSAAALVLGGCVGWFLWSNRTESQPASGEFALAAEIENSAPQAAGEASALPGQERSAVPDPSAPSDPPLVVEAELAHPYLYVLVVHTLDENGLPQPGASMRLAPVRSELNLVQALLEQEGSTTILWRGREAEMDIDLQYGLLAHMAGSRRLHLRAGTPHEVALLGDGVPMLSDLPIQVSGMRLMITLQPGANGEFTLESSGIEEVDDLRMERFPHPHARFAGAFVSKRLPAPPMEIEGALWAENLQMAEAAAGVLGTRMLASEISFSSIGARSEEPSPTTSPLDVLVKDDRGELVANTLVVLGREFDAVQQSQRTDEQGRAHFPAVEAGWWEARAGGQSAGLARERLFVEAPTPLQWNARLDRGAHLVGRVLDAEGKPASGVMVLYESIPGSIPRGTSLHMQSETRGGEEISERGDLPQPLPGAIRAPWVDRVLPREDGSFELSNLPVGLGRLLVVSSEDRQGPAMLVEEGVLPGEHEVVLRLPAKQARIQLRVVLPSPWGEQELEVRAISAATGRGTSFARDGERLRSAALAPGWYHVESGVGCLGWHDLGRHFVAEGETIDLGDFAPPAPAAVKVLLPKGETGEQPLPELCFYLRRADMDLRGSPKSLRGSEDLHLPAGSYWAFWKSPDGQWRHQALELVSGETAILDLQLP